MGLSVLQLGDASSLFILMAVVLLVGLIIGLVLLMKRRASTMSDEISKLPKAKFEAIVPTPVSASRNNSQISELKGHSLARTDHLRGSAEYFTLSREVYEIKLHLERFIRENLRYMEKQRQCLVDIEKLRSEVSSLQDRLSVDAQEVERLKSSLAEHRIELDSQRRGIEDQSAKVEKGWEEAGVGKLRSEVTLLQERLLKSDQELQKLKTSFNEQNLKGQYVLNEEAGVVEVHSELEVPPVMELASEPINPEIQVAQRSASNSCVSCGFPLQPEDNYCMHCGRSVGYQVVR